MSEKGLTTIALKKINRSKIYQYIYRSKLTSKLQIVQDLQMGLSTVSQNLNLLENEGLIEKNGYFDSTGGRKANAIQIVSDFRISIGVGILKNIFARTRPYDAYKDIRCLIEPQPDYSFPSGHTASSFAAVVPILADRNTRRLGIVALVVAILMAFREYMYVCIIRVMF